MPYPQISNSQHAKGKRRDGGRESRRLQGKERETGGIVRSGNEQENKRAKNEGKAVQDNRNTCIISYPYRLRPVHRRSRVSWWRHGNSDVTARCARWQPITTDLLLESWDSWQLRLYHLCGTQNATVHSSTMPVLNLRMTAQWHVLDLSVQAIMRSFLWHPYGNTILWIGGGVCRLSACPSSSSVLSYRGVILLIFICFIYL